MSPGKGLTSTIASSGWVAWEKPDPSRNFLLVKVSGWGFTVRIEVRRWRELELVVYRWRCYWWGDVIEWVTHIAIKNKLRVGIRGVRVRLGLRVGLEFTMLGFIEHRRCVIHRWGCGWGGLWVVHIRLVICGVPDIHVIVLLNINCH
jgi:hypothetical protein